MNDWFRFGDTAPIPTDLSTLIMALFVAFLCGQIMAWVYMFTHTGLSYSRSFVSSLIIIPITVSMVMMVLDNNIVTAFSLLAVFAIVRFRNILRDTMDTVYILSLIVIGLASGTQKFTTAIVGCGTMSIVFMYIWFTNFGARQRFDITVNFQYDRNVKDLGSIEALLERHSMKWVKASQRVRDGVSGVFMSYRLLLRDPDQADLFVSELAATPGVYSVSTMSIEDESEV